MTSSSIKSTIFSIQVKMARAYEHGDTLNKEIRSFINSKPYRISREFNRDAREQIWKLETDPPVVPSRIHGIIGDTISNLRSALDHIVWQLVLANGQTPTRRNAFPICAKKAEFQDRGTPMLGGVGSEPKAIIERFQPCNGGDRALWVLNELSNIDKHRFLPVIFVNVTSVKALSVIPIPSKASIEIIINTGPIQRGAELLRLAQCDVEVDFEPEFGIAFGDGTPVANDTVMDVFRATWASVTKVADTLQPFIEGA